MPNIVVIGAGVTGLTCALQLLESSSAYSVTIIAKDFPAPFSTIDPVGQIDYTSPWGGAHNRFVPPPAPPKTSESSSKAEEAEAEAKYMWKEHDFSLATYSKMAQLVERFPEAGITFMKGVEYLEAPSANHLAISPTGAELGLQDKGFRLLSKQEGELPEGVSWGCEYDTWCVNPMVYCCFLLNRFVYLGGGVLRKRVRSAEEAWGLDLGLGDGVDAVVNASGTGFGDPNVFVTRGQTVLVSNPCAQTITRQNSDGSWTFSVPRNFSGGTVIGGTKEPDNFCTVPDPQVRKSLLERFAQTHPDIGEYEVLADIVGRRPTRRGGMRLEREEVLLGTGEDGQGEGKGRKKMMVVHAYGLGGRGYELSWGVAEEVVKLVRECVGGGGVYGEGKDGAKL
ncbi:D-amino-acid oxidase [Zalerion maritima]|uniref:D-amino-acid oxidase n=1 Tax=Zalerion maritima TaxID=339359 RepID=A0AAD5RUQ1_9PEZI|nr:D-amino-acid oxidase [Zalerion maritima]